jgi:AcrR family transcriptional regulator
MPPHADQLLEERILKTAQKLWRTRGEAGLTLRAVAREAGTTTPTLYKRFRNKQALRSALAERVRLQLNEYLFAAKSLEDVSRRYLEFADEHPHEYQLLVHSWSDIFHPDFPRPRTAVVDDPICRALRRPSRRLFAMLLCHVSPGARCGIAAQPSR